LRLRTPLPILFAAVVVCAAQETPKTPDDSGSAEELRLPTATVVVTGSYEPLSLDEVDRSVVSLPAREQALLLNGITDLLQLDPSLDLRQRAPGGVQADLSIRGSTFGQTLVLLNGLRLNDPQSGHHDMDIPVPLEAVTRVETLRGSGSSLYGSDAVGGVVNIITVPPAHTDLRLRTALGNDGINQERGSLAGSFGKHSGQLLFSRDFSTGFMPNRDYRNLQLAATAHIATALGPGDVTLAYMDHPFGAEQFYGNFNSWENTKSWFASWQQALGEKTTASASYRRHSDLFVLYRDRPSVFSNHHAAETWQAAVRRREPVTQSITVYYGIEGLRESIVSNNLGRHSRARGAAYGAVDFRALRRFSLSLSAREEVYGRLSSELSPTIAGGVWLSSTWKLRASASRAFRIPSYTDLYYQDPGNRGNPDLKPERAWSYETGVEWIPGARIRAGATVFERRERDGIDYFRAGATDIWRALNIQSLTFRGVEGLLRIAPARNQTLDLRYTAMQARQDTVALGFTKYTFSYPKHSGVAAWQATVSGNLLFRTRLGVLDRLGRDPYPLWDLYAAWSGGRVRPFVQLTNVTSSSYQEIPGVQMPGRTVIGGIELVAFGR
jgi:iron complex outermembrane receptor protein